MGDPKDDSPTCPAWMGTFADMMSLMLCFFVLLLSFAEMDRRKYKQIAGSMAKAFGVQRAVEVKMIPMGTSIIAQEFSPGRPKPTVFPVMRQHTQDFNRQSLRFQERVIRKVMAEDIAEGRADVERKGDKIVIRVREKGTFASGNADMSPNFIPVLHKISEILKHSKKNIVVAGHTDNIPIATARFRSNWDLSAARAASVVHELLRRNNIDPRRIVVGGYADSRPIADNNTPENRAKNRRVEIIIGGEEFDADGKTVAVGAAQAAPASSPVDATQLKFKGVLW